MGVLHSQVCAHIVQAIRMEATRVREEWEHAISSKENANSQPSDDDASSDAYCFELLSMVLALSGSNVGRQYLAQQLTLMQDLFSLLHTASPRVQRQVGERINTQFGVSSAQWSFLIKYLIHGYVRNALLLSMIIAFAFSLLHRHFIPILPTYLAPLLYFLLYYPHQLVVIVIALAGRRNVHHVVNRNKMKTHLSPTFKTCCATLI